MTDRTASEIIDSLGHDGPTKPARDILNAARMQAEAERQAQAQRELVDRLNAGGSPIRNVPRGR